MCTNTNGFESGIPHSIDETILGCFKYGNSPYQGDNRGSETAISIGAGTWSISLSEKSSSSVVPIRNCICFIVSCVSFLMWLLLLLLLLLLFLLLLLLLLLLLVVVRQSSNTRLRRRCCCCCFWIRQQWTKGPEIPLLHVLLAGTAPKESEKIHLWNLHVFVCFTVGGFLPDDASAIDHCPKNKVTRESEPLHTTRYTQAILRVVPFSKLWQEYPTINMLVVSYCAKSCAFGVPS